MSQAGSILQLPWSPTMSMITQWRRFVLPEISSGKVQSNGDILQALMSLGWSIQCRWGGTWPGHTRFIQYYQGGRGQAAWGYWHWFILNKWMAAKPQSRGFMKKNCIRHTDQHVKSNTKEDRKVRCNMQVGIVSLQIVHLNLRFQIPGFWGFFNSLSLMCHSYLLITTKERCVHD